MCTVLNIYTMQLVTTSNWVWPCSVRDERLSGDDVVATTGALTLAQPVGSVHRRLGRCPISKIPHNPSLQHQVRHSQCYRPRASPPIHNTPASKRDGTMVSS